MSRERTRTIVRCVCAKDYPQLVLRVAIGALVIGAAVVVAGAAASDVVTGPNRVLAFHDLPHGWVPGIPRDVRRVSRIVGHLGGHTVAAAPTRNGNYCEAFWAKGGRGSWSGCVPRGPFKGKQGDFHGYLIRAIYHVTSTKVTELAGAPSPARGRICTSCTPTAFASASR